MASAGASAMPSAGAASPTANASQATGTRAAGVVASVPNCDITGITRTITPVLSSGDMFIECALSDSGIQTVARVNLTTNTLVRTYPNLSDYVGNVLGGFAVAGGALWVQMDNGSACLSPCTSFFHVLRVDLAGGNVTRDVVDRRFVGVDSGYVLVADLSGHVFRLDPVTGNSKGELPRVSASSGDDVCGSRWSRDTNSTGTATTLRRLDAKGTVRASFTEPGIVGELQEVGKECWAVAYTGDPSDLSSDSTAVYRFIRIAPSKIDLRSPTFTTGTLAAIFAGTFWTITVAATDPGTPAPENTNLFTTLQRIDPASWRAQGTIWTYPGAAPAFAAAGSLWAAQAGEPSPALNRLDVPLGPIGS